MKLGAAPQGVYSDDGLRLAGLLHPNGNDIAVTTLYSSLAALQSDAANVVNFPIGEYKVGNRLFQWNGSQLIETAPVGANNWPHVNVAHSVIRSFINAQGANALEQHRQALEIALPALMASTAWEKIVELWVPLGANITGALQLLKYPSGGSAALTQTGTVTYSATGGITGNGTNGYLSSANVLTTLNNAYTNGVGMTNNGWGMAFHTPGLPVNGSSLAANSVFGGALQGANYNYVGGQLLNSWVMDNNVFELTWPAQLSWQNASGTVTPPWGMGRMSWIQALGGVASIGAGGLTLSTAPASGSNAVPAVGMTVCGLNGGVNLTTQAITGYAVFNGMTNAELAALSAFFDQANHLAYRTVLDGHVSIGDSISLGYGLSAPTTQCWPAVFSSFLGLTVNNYAQNGSTLAKASTLGNGGAANTSMPAYACLDLPIANGGANVPLTDHNLIAMQSGGGAMLSLALGINDLSYTGNLSAYISALTLTIQQFEALGWPVQNMIIPSITYCSASGGSVANGYYTQSAVQAWNAAIQQVCNEFGCIFVDFYTPLLNNAATWLQADGMHPNQAGHFALAQACIAAVVAARPGVIGNFVSPY